MINFNHYGKTQMMLIFIVSTVFGSFLFGIIGNLSALIFLDIKTFSPVFDVDLLTEQQQLHLFRIIQPFNTIGMFLFSPLMIRFFYRSKSSLKFSDFSISYSSIISASVLIIIVKPIVSWLSVVSNNFDFTLLGEFGESILNTSNLLADKMALVTVSNSIEELMLNMLIIALIPAIAEEFFFRGFLQQFISKFTKSYHVSVWATALVFGIIHLNIVNILPLVFLGAILGYIYHFSENIWIPILAHFINNASLLWFIYYYSYDVKGVGAETIPIQSVIFSVVMTLALLFFMYTAWEHRKGVTSKRV